MGIWEFVIGGYVTVIMIVLHKSRAWQPLSHALSWSKRDAWSRKFNHTGTTMKPNALVPGLERCMSAHFIVKLLHPTQMANIVVHGCRFLVDTPYINLFYKLLGARMPLLSVRTRTFLRDWDLLHVEPGAVISGSVFARELSPQGLAFEQV